MAHRFLLVDDDVAFRTVMKQILEAHGLEVVGALESGAKLVPAYKQLKPDFVLMDLMMPEVSGLSAVQELKGHDPEARIIVITGLERGYARKEVERMGVAGVLDKPFRWEQLEEILMKIA